jgi:1-aminocyclopropane-1-carboxylate deaminase
MTFFEEKHISLNQNIYRDKVRNISIDLKREDEIHPLVSGNKFRKLKYNIKALKSGNHDTLLTYGGAFSNHIAASSSAANICGIKSIGVIRGEEIKEKISQDPSHNPTLAYALSQGMHLHFVSRESYSNKDSDEEIFKLKKTFGSFYRIPEGGTNALAVKGCEEILNKEDKKYDIIACCVGTGGTISGIINASKSHQNIYGFSALKNHKHQEIAEYTTKTNWTIYEDDYFGGYAKTNEELIEFMNSFFKCTGIKLDPIYTSKMMFKIFKMIDNNQIPNHTKILCIHSGGLQGVKAYNNMLKSKNRTSIKF